MEVEWKFVGGPELNKALRELPIAVERKVARQALRAGGKVLQKHIAATLPVDAVTPDGVHLNKSVGIFRPRDMRSKLVVRVGYRGLARRYGHIIEYGSSRIQPNPVWRRAMSSVGGEVVQTVVDKLAKDTLRETAKLFKRTI